MTDLDAMSDLPFDYADAQGPTFAGAAGKPATHRRHRWVRVTPMIDGVLGAMYEECICGTVKDEAVSRRSRNNRKRGNRLQAHVAKAAGIANIGALGLPEDAGTSRDWLRLQVKSGGYFPRLMDRWLRAITVDADQLRGVVLVETPGAGRKAKRLIVLDYEEFLDWYGPTGE